MDKKTSYYLLGLAVAVVGLVFCVWAYSSLPQNVITQWGFNGRHNYSDKSSILWLGAMPLVLLGLLFWLNNSDPLMANASDDDRAIFGAMTLLVTIFLVALDALVILVNSGMISDLIVPISALLSVFFLLLAPLMKNLPRNWFFGFRTPWALSSLDIWKKTHNMGAFLFAVTGLLGLATIAFQGSFALIVTIAMLLASAVSLVAYSYFLWQVEKANEAYANVAPVMAAKAKPRSKPVSRRGKK